MLDITKVRYKKRHLIFLTTYKASQVVQRLQKKTFDHLFLKTRNSTVVKFNQYEAIRRILSRKIFKLLRFSLSSKPYVAVTAKPKEMRMGKGKGAYSYSHFPRTFGQKFAKISWNHKQSLSLFFVSVRKATKKSSQNLSF